MSANLSVRDSEAGLKTQIKEWCRRPPDERVHLLVPVTTWEGRESFTWLGQRLSWTSDTPLRHKRQGRQRSSAWTWYPGTKIQWLHDYSVLSSWSVWSLIHPSNQVEEWKRCPCPTSQRSQSKLALWSYLVLLFGKNIDSLNLKTTLILLCVASVVKPLYIHHEELSIICVGV